MSDFLASHLREIETPPSLAVCLGNDAGHLLPLCLEIGARQVVLAEPNPKAAARLRHMVPDSADVTVIEAMIAESAGVAELGALSLHRFSGLREATGLRTLFPSLRESGTSEIMTMDVTGLCAQLPQAEGSGARLLILGPNGEEHAILSALLAEDALAQFDQIFLTLPEIALFEGAGTADELTELLEAQGFERAACDMSDPDIPTCHFRLDRAAQELTRAQDAIGQELEELTTRNATLQAEVDTLRKENTGLQDALGRAQDDTKALSLVADAAKGEIQALQQQADAARGDAETVRGELEATQLAAKTARDDAELAQAKAQTAQDEINQAQNEAETLSKQLEAAKEETRIARKTTETTRSEAESLQQSLTLAVRTQTLRENDLRDLQVQYAALLEQAAENDRLFTQLGQHIERAIDELPTTRARATKAVSTTNATPRKTAARKTTASKSRGKSGSARDG